MECLRQLGRSGLQVSVVGVGTKTYDRSVTEAQVAIILQRALEVGINFVDTCNTYGRGVAEEQIGSAIRGHREEYIVATKAGSSMGAGPNQSGNSRQHLTDSVHQSLRRLQTDYIDLFQVQSFDPKTPIEETMRVLDDLVRQGKVRYIGCSDFSAWQVCEANWVAKAAHLTPLVSVQRQYNLLDRRIEPELVPFCEQYGVGIVPYGPLAGCFLTREYRRGDPNPEGVRGYSSPNVAQRTLADRRCDMLERLEAFARERWHTVEELAVAWLLARPVVSAVIIEATRPEEIEEHARAAAWKLTPEDMAEIDWLTKE